MRPSYRSRWYPVWDYWCGARAHRRVWRPAGLVTPPTQPQVLCYKVPWWQRYRWHRETKTLEHCHRYYQFFRPEYAIVESFGCGFCGKGLWRKAVCQQCQDTVPKGLKDWDLGLNKELLRAAYSHDPRKLYVREGGTATTEVSRT